jgi:hypothetical protein
VHQLAGGGGEAHLEAGLLEPLAQERLLHREPGAEQPDPVHAAPPDRCGGGVGDVSSLPVLVVLPPGLCSGRYVALQGI